MEFSYIDLGLKDFIRDENNKVIIKEFSSWEDADDFIADGGLDEYGWTNTGTKKYCWNDEDDEQRNK